MKDIDHRFLVRIPLVYNPELDMYKSEEDRLMDKLAKKDFKGSPLNSTRPKHVLVVKIGSLCFF